VRFHAYLIFASSFFASAAFGTVAQAADCKPLQIVNTIKMESINDGKKLLVPVTINGTPQKFILDTGGYTSQISHKAAMALGLHEEETDNALFDLYGNSSRAGVRVESFGLGQLNGHKVTLHVSPITQLDEAGGATGLLSTDLFLLYDIDLDFGAGRLNYFSQDHCDGRVAYWPERPVAIVPFILDGWHISLPVTIDGHEVKAVIDTGADETVMPDTVAKGKFGLVPGSDDTPLIDASKSDPQLKYYSHKFQNLGFEGLAVSNPNIIVMTNRMGAGTTPFKSSFRGVLNDPFNRVQPDELIIGMNVLKHLHVYIAYKEKKLYISPAGTGESVLFKDAAAPAK